MDKLRILFVTHNSDFVGGGELSQLQLLQSLYTEGERVMLAVPDTGWCENEAKSHGVPVLHLPMPAIGVLTLFSTVRGWMKKISEIEKPDVIHANTPRSCFYAGVAGRLLGIPVVFHCRIADSDPKLDWILVRLANCVVANSKTTAGRFRRWPKLDVRTVYNGVDADLLEAGGQDKQPFGAELVLLCVARVSRWKRHDLVLDAFEQLAKEFDGLHLVCVGAIDPYETDWWDTLQVRSQQSDFSDRIHWVGMQKDMAQWYHGADVLFLASEREPFGRVVIEAMAHGIPVVAFNAGGPAEIITDGEQGVLVTEEDNVAEKMTPLFADRLLYEKMAAAGKKRAKEFSLTAHVSSMRGILSSLAGGNHGD
ncbi:glycosyltransferase family 4 protein [Pseudomonadota bacterium]